MHAILISEENMPKIKDVIIAADRPEHTISVYLRHPQEWYAVTGYVTRDGALMKDFTVLPAYVIPENFEYDPAKIQTDWDQIVRK